MGPTPRPKIQLERENWWHTAKEYEKIYYLYNEAFWKEQGRPLKLVWKKQRKEACVEFTWRLEGEVGMRAPVHRQGLVCFELPSSTKGGSTQTFLSAFPDIAHKRKRETWGLKAVSSQKLKNGVRLFITALKKGVTEITAKETVKTHNIVENTVHWQR